MNFIRGSSCRFRPSWAISLPIGSLFDHCVATLTRNQPRDLPGVGDIADLERQTGGLQSLLPARADDHAGAPRRDASPMVRPIPREPPLPSTTLSLTEKRSSIAGRRSEAGEGDPSVVRHAPINCLDEFHIPHTGLEARLRASAFQNSPDEISLYSPSLDEFRRNRERARLLLAAAAQLDLFVGKIIRQRAVAPIDLQDVATAELGYSAPLENPFQIAWPLPDDLETIGDSHRVF